MSLHANITMLDLQRYRWRLCLIKYELKCFCIFTVYFYEHCHCFRKWLAHFLLIRSIREIVRIIHFHKNDGIFHKFRYQRSLSESNIAIFARRVNFNYAFPTLQASVIFAVPEVGTVLLVLGRDRSVAIPIECPKKNVFIVWKFPLKRLLSIGNSQQQNITNW